MIDDELTAPPKQANWQLTVIAILSIVATVTYLGPILKPLFSAIFVYFLIRASADWLRSKGCPGRLAYLILFGLASVAVTGLIGILTVNALRFQQDWPRYRDQLLVKATEWHLHHWISEVSNILTPGRIIGYVASPAAEAAEFSLMIVFYLLLLTVAEAKLPGRVRRVLAVEQANRVLAIGSSISAGMARYMEIKTAVNAGLAFSVGLILAWFGVDYWLLWAVLMFALNYVTYIGSLAALAPPTILGFVQLPLPKAILLAAILMAIRFVWIDILEVRLSGKHVNIDSLFLLICMAYWGWAWGLTGVVLAMPIATCIRAGLYAVKATRPLACLLSED